MRYLGWNQSASRRTRNCDYLRIEIYHNVYSNALENWSEMYHDGYYMSKLWKRWSWGAYILIASLHGGLYPDLLDVGEFLNMIKYRPSSFSHIICI